MGYEVTATRRRPANFEDMIGQEFVVATLQKSIVAGKIAHAYLFSGPRGCGKTSSARILARALNCLSGPTATPCGSCAACLEITRGASLDVIEIDGASNTSVNDVRQIKDEVQFPPNSYRYKVYIIDEVHMLSTSAFNALLKTIEEPPPYVIFIFATTELHKVPATIKSRCQQFNVRLVSIDLLKKALVEAAKETQNTADDEALLWIAREATGSVRDAYTLFDQVAAFSDGNITFDKIRDTLGLVGVDRINPVIELCVEKRAAEALELVDQIVANGVSVEQFIVDLGEYFRTVLLIKAGVTRESLLGQNPSRFSAKVLSSWSSIQIERALSIILQVYRDIRYSIDPRFELELSISRLSWLSDYISSSDMKQAIDKAKHMLERGSPGPFLEADRVPTEKDSGTVRKEEDIKTPSLDEGAVKTKQDPFAGLKERFSVLPAQKKDPEIQAVSIEASDDKVATRPAHADASGDSAEVRVVNTDASVDIESNESVVVQAQIAFDDIQSALVGSFQHTKNMLATSLSQCFNWADKNSFIQFSIDTIFLKNFLEQEKKSIRDKISELLQRSVEIQIILESKEEQHTEEVLNSNGIPEQVEMVKQMFRGTFV